MPTTMFEQIRRQAALAHAAGTPTPLDVALEVPPSTAALDPAWFTVVFEQTFGADAPQIFDPLTDAEQAWLTRLYGPDSVTVHRGTMLIIDDDLTVLLARVCVDGQAYQLWQPNVADTCWYVDALATLDEDCRPSPAQAGCIVPETPTQALQALVGAIARHQRGGFFLPPVEAFVDLDPLTIAIADAAAAEAAQPALAELTIAMIQGDLAATRAVLEATFGASFAQPIFWTVQYQRGQSGVGEALLTERPRDPAAAVPQYRLCVVSTPSSWRWLLKALDGPRSSVDFATSDCPATMERRLMRAIGTLRGQR